MNHYKQGINTSQGHKGIPEGLFEEEQGLLGFFGPVSHLLKSKPSTRWVEIDGPLKPRLFDLVKYPKTSGRRRLFFNNHTNVYWQWVDKPDLNALKSFRSADGDLLYFCHEGSGEIWTEYGLLNYERGQYIVMPKCIGHTIMAKEKSNFLVIENLSSHYQQPERGIVGRHAIYDQNALGMPDLEALNASKKKLGAEVKEILVQHAGTQTRYVYKECVYDVVGWKGDLYPFTLHTKDMMPLMSHRAHLPPSAHTTFVAREFVVCTFLPRPLESDKDALRVPFYHQNIDYDEILFYHAGDFFSRDNLHAGMLSYHPAGFAHGPHPKAIEKIKAKTHTDEYAVMLDSRFPLQRESSLDEIEVVDYWKSWLK